MNYELKGDEITFTLDDDVMQAFGVQVVQPEAAPLPANSENKLKILLKELQLENCFDALSECGFNFDNIKYLRETNLAEIFPGRANVALKAEFQDKFFTWKMGNEDPSAASCSSRSSCCMGMGNSRHSRASTPQSNSDDLSAHVLDILHSSKIGQGLLASYSKSGKIDDQARKQLLNCLVENFFDMEKNRYRVLPPKKLEQMAAEICEVFPTEKKAVYYISRKEAEKPNPTGLLFNRFNNLNRKRNNSARSSNSVNEEPKSKKDIPPIRETGNDEQSISIQNKMQVMKNSEMNAKELWESTHIYRSKMVKEQALDNILNSWSFYTQAGGEIFIDLDFMKIHPRKGYNLFNKWEDAEKRLSAIYNDSIKDKQYKDIFEQSRTETTGKDSKDYILVMLLNTILKPTSRTIVKKGNIKTHYKTTIKDAIYSSFVHIKTINDLELAKEKKLKNAVSGGSTIQPFIVAVGPELTNLNEFYISLGSSILKFTSFLKIVDFVLRSEFDNESLDELNLLIKSHHQTYMTLFNKPLKPKYHFLTHYVTIIKQSGPLKYLWTFRYESKHKEAKMYARNITSRKNISYTLSMKAAFKFSAFLEEYKCGLPENIQYEKSHFLNIELTYSKLIDNLEDFKDLFSNNLATKVLKYKGTIYKIGCFLTIKTNLILELFEIIDIVISISDTPYIIANKKEIVTFSEHFQAYLVGKKSEICVIIKLDKFTSQPLHLYLLANGETYLRIKEI